MERIPWLDVLAFWFGTPDVRAAPPPEKQPMWWGASGPALDAEIRDRFGALNAQALAGELTEEWARRVEGRLGLIILLDQFSRNIHRGTALAFAGDEIAREMTVAAIHRLEDRALGLHQRAFLYMPLEHAEDLALQDRSVALFEEMRDEAPPEQRAAVENYVNFARQHRDIIACFGRFPYRNAALGRADTPEEEAWLASGPETFGQGKKA